METGIGVLVTIVVFYFLPWLLAVLRRHHNAGAIFALNLFLGWSLIGWVVALVWAMTWVKPRWDGELIARGSTGRGVVALSTGMPKRDFTVSQFIGVILLFVLVLIAIMQGVKMASAGPIYRGNAAPGMMNRGPEARYFNRARPPTVIVPSYGGTVYTSRPFVPNAGAIVDEPSAGERLGPALEGGWRVALHNGSLMRIVMTPDGYLDIFYERPRAGLPVLPGVRLLRGIWDGPPPQNLIAVAFVFPPFPCPPVPYGVRGTVDQSGALVLFGQAPIVAPGCRVVGYDWTQNSELRFEQAR